MKFKMNKKRNAGFTLVEILAATAIVVILLAVGMVSVVRYARLLQITELDNAAREIYLAAENRAVLLTGSERMNKLLSKGTELNAPAQADATPLAAGESGASVNQFMYIRYSGSETDEMKDLLPEGAIDPALRKGCFYVVYNVVYKDAGDKKAVTASVTDVFYDEDGTALTESVNFDSFYGTWKGSSRQTRLDKKMMVGYYGGSAAESGDADALSMPKLEIVNGEELKVILTYTVPAGETRSMDVALTYEGTSVELSGTKYTASTAKWMTEVTAPDLLTGTVTHTCTWVLDTLDPSGHKFADLFQAAPKPGKNFTVTAKIINDLVESPAATATGNSLFANESGDGKTAYIENLRHLQNLDKSHSKVEDKTEAVQIADIEQSTSELIYYQDYEFKPVENSELTSYCGSYAAAGTESVTHFIKGLKVTAANRPAAGKPAAGLFAAVKGDSADTPWKFKDVRLINTEVEGKDQGAKKDLPAGALVGTAENASFDGCWVYWEMDDEAELRDYLTGDDGVKYQIVGSHAGGLAGELKSGSITNCLVATLVEGKNAAGGLVGKSTDSVTVSHSYADCYITAPAAAGLIGDASGTVSLENVYAAGFIDNDIEDANASAAGLWLGSTESTDAKNVYSVMHYEKTDGIVPLAPKVDPDKNKKCYYLGSGNNGKTFEEMIGENFRNDMGTEFRLVELVDSRPYNLREGMALDVYPFPELVGLPHYGDWNTEFVKAALVYFEQYKTDDFKLYDPEGSYGFSGGGTDCLRSGDNVVVPLDGYAVALREKVDQLDNSFTITFTLRAADGTVTPYNDIKYTKDELLKVQVSEKETYYLAPLPKDLIISGTAAQDFYQILSFTVGASGESTWSAYNPHFAKTARSIPEGMDVETFATSMSAAARNAQAYVRTPRHLQALSKFEAYSHAGKQEPGNRWTTYQYQFIQELNLDYTQYKGYSWGEDNYTQKPIGKSGAPFNGTYNGRSNTIRNVCFQLDETDNRQYAGLFGLTAGTLRNIVYMMDGNGAPVSVAKGSGERLYMGGLAGGNNGTIVNCAVAGAKLSGSVFGSTSVYAGGLVGMNAGQIQNCAAEATLLSANSSQYATAYAGGLVGQNNAGGTVRDSYAVGHVSAKVDDTSTARVCGFVGHNSGAISDSYAAVWLESSGAGVETYGFCGEKQGTQSNTYFVNKGNFSYREQYYNATYEIRNETKAQPIPYSDLTADKQPLTAMKLGGRAVEGNLDKDKKPIQKFPLPTGVTDGSGRPVHYGQWPEELYLGTMGVYYWEKLELPTTEDGKKLEVYSVSMLRADGKDNKNEVTKVSTLSNARSDGGVVTDYGYGYYTSTGTTVTVTTSGIYYTADGGQGTELSKLSNNNAELTDVNGKLEELMNGYDFHSFRTFVPNPDPNKNGNFVKDITKPGLYAKGITDNRGNLTSPNGRITLNQSNAEITFEINPHFADALSVNKLPDNKWNAENLMIAPGQEKNPYEVRAMGQLSAINWNSTEWGTKTVINGNKNYNKFPYLSYKDNIRSYVWKQTHDVHGNNGIYTPIAEYYDCAANGGHGSLYGWFSGSYDGDDYMIENVNIQGQTSSVAGLFGVVFNGSLKNIVLYSSDGQGKITNQIETSTMDSAWYSMGTLAGIASTRQGTPGYQGSAVENCSASGYTIEYKTYNRRDRSGNTNDVPGGSTIGGLLGASDMELKNCSAVTTIKILKSGVQETYGNDNLRAGGLIGVCQNSITNCYAGGSIEVQAGVITKQQNGLFLGGIVGGGYFKPLTVINGLSTGIGGGGDGVSGTTKLENCYAYVELPDQDTEVYVTTGQKASTAAPTTNGRAEKTRIMALYAVGGQGDGNSSYSATNCYYLESEVMKNNPEGIETVNLKSVRSDLDLARDAVQVLVLKTDNQPMRQNGTNHDSGPFVERRVSLTSDDVDKRFAVSYKANQTGYTYHYDFKITLSNGKTYNCPYRGTTPSAGMPVFITEQTNNEQDKDGPANGESRWVIFKGWATGFTWDASENYYRADGLTTDPLSLQVDDWNSLMAVTYKELSGEGKTSIYDKLTAFAPVTDTATKENFEIPGKYSYSTKAKLRGLRYPFPTILTRENGTIHVHYGNWPLNGIERDKGGAPIELNLFSTTANLETLTLSEGVTKGGTWEIITPDGIATMAFDGTQNDRELIDTNGTCTLSVRGVKAGLEKMTVQYTENDGTKYTLKFTVHVTAVLRVVPEFSPICLFPGGTTKVPLTLCDEQGKPLELTDEQMKDLKISIENSRCGSSELLEAAALIEEGGSYYLQLRAITPEPGEELPKEGLLAVNVWYTYPNEENEYFDLSTLSLKMIDLETTQETLENGSEQITFPEFDWTVGEDKKTVVTTVKEVGIAKIENPDSSQPGETPTVEFDESKNFVTLTNFRPGANVTLTVELGLKLKDAVDGAETVCTVTLTVKIPEPAPEPDPAPGTGGADQPGGENVIAEAPLDETLPKEPETVVEESEDKTIPPEEPVVVVEVPMDEALPEEAKADVEEPKDETTSG